MGLVSLGYLLGVFFVFFITLGGLGELLVVSGGLGVSWGVFWVVLGSLLSRLGGSLGHLGGSLGPLGAPLGVFWVSLGPLWAVLGAMIENSQKTQNILSHFA